MEGDRAGVRCDRRADVRRLGSAAAGHLTQRHVRAIRAAAIKATVVFGAVSDSAQCVMKPLFVISARDVTVHYARRFASTARVHRPGPRRTVGRAPSGATGPATRAGTRTLS